jgi:hypothetical protein
VNSPNLSRRLPLSPVKLLNIFLRIRGVLQKERNPPLFYFKISYYVYCQLKNIPLLELNSPSWTLKKIHMYVHVMHKNMNVLMPWPDCFSEILKKWFEVMCFVYFCLCSRIGTVIASFYSSFCRFICRSIQEVK